MQVKALDIEIQKVLSRSYACGPTLVLRSQALTPEQEQTTCKMLGEIEQKFHTTFSSAGKPVKHDSNVALRANIYQSRDDFVKYAGTHFDMPTDNGGMYLEGLPEQPGNQAEFVANQKKDGSIHNLGHEYVHYLDGRFNLYGDFCTNLHDSHSAPENCAKPAPMAPYLVWWTEGVAEYIAKGTSNLPASELAGAKTYALSQLFETGYESNNGTARVYSWGYLAVRFMMEKHRDKIEQMLNFTRNGDFPRYQSLIRSWGDSMDVEFASWLMGIATAVSVKK
ncbi:collagenase [Undibacterium parvum]|uniref:Collagenase n=2 Tax=Undibacterium parvum TaxID=401471 RepID=A0A3S5HM97_9BURK|nr:collagenase [Undibacterium parvum]